MPHIYNELTVRLYRRGWWLVAAILSMMTLTTYGAINPQANDPEYRWDLSELYPSKQAWTLEHDKILAQADALDKYQDTLGQSATDMLAALRAISAAKKESARLSTDGCRGQRAEPARSNLQPAV